MKIEILDAPINHAIRAVRSDLWHNNEFECGRWCSFVEFPTREIFVVVADCIWEKYGRQN